MSQSGRVCRNRGWGRRCCGDWNDVTIQFCVVELFKEVRHFHIQHHMDMCIIILISLIIMDDFLLNRHMLTHTGVPRYPGLFISEFSF
jgi:hypothetical protein